MTVAHLILQFEEGVFEQDMWRTEKNLKGLFKLSNGLTVHAGPAQPNLVDT